MICKVCGTNNEDYLEYCKKCSAPLHGGDSAATEAPASSRGFVRAPVWAKPDFNANTISESDIPADFLSGRDDKTVQRAQPEQPVQPTQPVQPVQPMQPMQPVQPMQPMEPVQPVDLMTAPQEETKTAEAPKEEVNAFDFAFPSVPTNTPAPATNEQPAATASEPDFLSGF